MFLESLMIYIVLNSAQVLDKPALWERDFVSVSTNSVFCSMASEKGEFKFFPDKKRSLFNNVAVYLSYPVGVSGGDTYQFSRSDMNHVIRPLLTQKYKLSGKTVLLDPGHGGTDSGAKGALYVEKDLNLAIAKLTEAELTARGFTVVMSRTGDVDVALNSRGPLSQKNNADVFVSIHCNASTKPDPVGVETYVLTPAWAESTDNHTSTVLPYPANRLNAENIVLGYRIQSKILEKTGMSDRGVKHSRFRVLTTNSCPAVLVEVGFLSNPAEEKIIGSPEYQQKVAQAIAEALQSLQ